VLIDVFPYHNERLALLGRFLELEEHVDLFVAIEGNLTHSGLPREARFWSDVDGLGLPRDRFLLLSAELDPNLDPFARDAEQREFMAGWLKDFKQPSTNVLFGDADEFPSSSSLQEALRAGPANKVTQFAQTMSMGFINYVETSGRLLSFAGEHPNVAKSQRRWLGTCLTSAFDLLDIGLTEIRGPNTKKIASRIEGGWHWSYVSGDSEKSVEERVALKLEASAHQEFNNDKVAKRVESRINRGKDPLGRRGVKFSFVDPKLLLSSKLLFDQRFTPVIGGDYKIV